MKRSPALLGLSREHHEALLLARRASSADPRSAAARGQRTHLLTRWAEQFEPHFALEEEVLLPALAAAGQAGPAAEALAQHTGLRHLMERLREGDLPALPAWGDAMLAHVHFEERALFPLAERSLDLTALAGSLNRTTFPPIPHVQRP
ncbi:MAG: hemerythrin domain-containing protein [Caldimonas sp.]